MLNDNPKVTIIVPVYNVENFLEKSVNSILSQTFKDIEVILVDDGSTDSSSIICDKFKETDNRIICIHQSNSGAHVARNNALNMAKGEFVCFFDADDYVNSNMVEDLYNIAINYKSDLVISGFYIETYYTDNKFVTYNYIPYTDDREILNFNNKDTFRKKAYINFDRNMFYSPWNKMYRLDYIKNNNILFPITYRDDFPFVLSIIKDISNVSFTINQYYHFIRKRTDSETQKYVANLFDKREEEHEEMLTLYRYWGIIQDSNSFEMISRRYIDRVLECITNLFNINCKLSLINKFKTISKYIHNKNFNESLIFAKPRKWYLKIIYFIFKTKITLLSFILGWFVNFIKKNNIILFSNLKIYR